MNIIAIVKMYVSMLKWKIKCPYEMIPTEITYHETAGDASAMAEISYMIGNDKLVSYHTAVDDVRAVEGIRQDRNTWNAGDGKYGAGNRKSIAVECCYSKSGGERYLKARDNSITYIAMKMKEYNIPASKIYFHQNRSGKHCPGRTLNEGVTLSEFRSMCQKRYDELYNKPVINVESYSGTVTSKVNGLNYHKTPSWSKESVCGHIDKGDHLEIKGRIKVDGVYMYLTEKGYITSASVYVTYTPVKKTEYLNLYPTVAERTVYNSKLQKVGVIKPKKYKGLSYKIRGYCNNNRYVKILTSSYGEVRICIDKKAAGNEFDISTKCKY